MSDSQLTDEVRDRIIDALVAGRKIEAIKEYREATGCSLKEAKDYIERLSEQVAKENPGLVTAKKGSGCAGVLLLMIAAAAALPAVS